MRQKVRWKEYIYIIIFLISCLNSYLIYIFLILIFFKIREGGQGFLKICLLYTLRQSIVLPGLAIMTGTQSNLKQILILGAALWILGTYIKRKEGKIPVICLPVAAFGISALISTVFFGSFPVAGAIKVINFVIVLVAIIVATIESIEYFDIEQYMFYAMSFVMMISVCVIPYRGAYVNGSAGMLFQGVWNHPNDFGVICAIYLAMLLVHYDKIKGKQLVQISLVFIMIYLSKARGAMIAALIILLIYFIVCGNKYNRIILISVITLSIFVIYITPIKDDIGAFFFKGTQNSNSLTEAFSSRDEVIEVAKNRFLSNPMFGRGLLIPYASGERSLSFSVKGIEPGNIFLELLGGTGGIGCISFFYLILKIFRQSREKYKIYPVVIVAASISEVSFFSVNNYGAIYYMLLALAIIQFYRKNSIREER